MEKKFPIILEKRVVGLVFFFVKKSIWCSDSHICLQKNKLRALTSQWNCIKYLLCEIYCFRKNRSLSLCGQLVSNLAFRVCRDVSTIPATVWVLPIYISWRIWSLWINIYFIWYFVGHDITMFHHILIVRGNPHTSLHAK